MKESDVYMKTDAGLDEIVDLVRSEFGLNLQREDFDGETFFVALDGDRRITLGVNEFVEPEFDEIAECTIYLTVDGSDDAGRLRYARRIFERLAELRPMALLLVDNMSVRDRFEPG